MIRTESKKSMINEFQNVPINDQRLINRLIITVELLETYQRNLFQMLVVIGLQLKQLTSYLLIKK